MVLEIYLVDIFREQGHWLGGWSCIDNEDAKGAWEGAGGAKSYCHSLESWRWSIPSSSQQT